VTAGQVVARVRPRMYEWSAARWATPAVLVALVAVSAVVRTRIINAGFWIDEGISVGIAHHPLTDIPHLLRQDGSPPLYYLLLHAWIGWFGDSEAATHALSLLFSLACIPLAFAVGSALFGRRTGWVCAALTALDPYLTAYGQETRMYTVLAFLSFVAALGYVRGVVEGRRRWLPLLVGAVTLMLYTHNWSIFFAIGLALTTAIFVRAHWREAVMAGVATLILYAPWVPTLLFQAKHTGAPWSTAPSLHSLLLAPGAVLSGDGPLTAFAIVGGLGLATLVKRRDVLSTTVLSLGCISASTILVAWVASLANPAWATRYFAVVIGPILLLCAAGFVRAGRLGWVALAIVAIFWTATSPKAEKSDVREVSELSAPYVHAGDLVISTHPEQTPVIRYYLGSGFRWATPLGHVADPRIMDWRDVIKRIKRVSTRTTLEPELAAVKPGGRVLLVQPLFIDYHAWKARWTKRVYRRSVQWAAALNHDPRFRHVAHLEPNQIVLKKKYFKPVQADVYLRRQ
jgi:hypothetical protein